MSEEINAMPMIDYREVLCPRCNHKFMLPILVYGRMRDQLIEQRLADLVKKKESIDAEIKRMMQEMGKT